MRLLYVVDLVAALCAHCFCGCCVLRRLVGRSLKAGTYERLPVQCPSESTVYFDLSRLGILIRSDHLLLRSVALRRVLPFSHCTSCVPCPTASSMSALTSVLPPLPAPVTNGVHMPVPVSRSHSHSHSSQSTLTALPPLVSCEPSFLHSIWTLARVCLCA